MEDEKKPDPAPAPAPAPDPDYKALYEEKCAECLQLQKDCKELRMSLEESGIQTYKAEAEKSAYATLLEDLL